MSGTSDSLQSISYAYQDRCGEQLYLYSTFPTEREEHYVFNNRTIKGGAKALNYANYMLEKAMREPQPELVFEADFPGAWRVRIRRHRNTVSAAIVDPVGQYFIESELFPDEAQAREWISKKAQEYARG